jgi:hypothetical protein
MTLEGRIENGQVVFDQPVPLPDGTPVRVELSPATAVAPAVAGSFLEQLGSVVGAIHDWPEDLAINHDHYLVASRRWRPVQSGQRQLSQSSENQPDDPEHDSCGY